MHPSTKRLRSKQQNPETGFTRPTWTSHWCACHVTQCETPAVSVVISAHKSQEQTLADLSKREPTGRIWAGMQV